MSYPLWHAKQAAITNAETPTFVSQKFEILERDIISACLAEKAAIVFYRGEDLCGDHDALHAAHFCLGPPCVCVAFVLKATHRHNCIQCCTQNMCRVPLLRMFADDNGNHMIE